MKNIFIHRSSYIDENVDIGSDSKIWHFCHFLNGTKVGTNCSFGQNCVVGPNVKIGNYVKVQNNVSLFEGVECEDNVFIGPSVVFTNVINPRSHIKRKKEFKKTILKKGSTIGANSTIICGVIIGEYSFIGGGSVVTKDTKPFGLYYGVPAKQKGWVSISGNKLSFDKKGKAIDRYENKVYNLINGKIQIS